MDIIVCIKQVPDHEAPQESFVVNVSDNKVEFRGIQPVLSLFDENALEAALKIKDEYKGDIRISVLCAGRSVAKPVMMKALAAGADELVTVTDESFDPLIMDSFETSAVLAAAIRKTGPYDLILVGRQAADWNAGQVGVIIASKLGIPVITLAKKVLVSDRKVIVDRLIPDGHEVVETDLPAVVMVSNEVGELRYPTMIQRRDARSKPVISWRKDDIDYQPGKDRKVELRLLIKSEMKPRQCHFVSGNSPAELGNNLAMALLSDNVIREMNRGQTV
jgi:electron transfer flavoprotein beta subunit